MIQEIFTYIIIGVATAYTLYSFIKMLIPSKDKKKHLCSVGCSGCSLKNDLTLKNISVKKAD